MNTRECILVLLCLACPASSAIWAKSNADNVGSRSTTTPPGYILDINNVHGYTYESHRTLGAFNPSVDDGNGNVLGTAFKGGKLSLLRLVSPSGKQLWQTNLPKAVTSGYGIPNLAVNGDACIVYGHSATYGANVATGQHLFTLPGTIRGVLTFGKTWIGHTDNNTMCEYSNTGAKKWCHHLPGFIPANGDAMVVATDNRVAVPTTGYVNMYHRAPTGLTFLWKVPLPNKATLHMSPVGTLFVTSTNLTAYEPGAGSPLWTVENTVAIKGGWAFSLKYRVIFVPRYHSMGQGHGVYSVAKINAETGAVEATYFKKPSQFRACAVFMLDDTNNILWMGCGGYDPRYPPSTWNITAFDHLTRKVTLHLPTGSLSRAAEFWDLLLLTSKGQVVGTGEASDVGSFRLDMQKPGYVKHVQMNETTYAGASIVWSALKDQYYLLNTAIEVQVLKSGKWTKLNMASYLGANCSVVPLNIGGSETVRVETIDTLNKKSLGVSNSITVHAKPRPSGSCPTPWYFTSAGGFSANKTDYEIALPSNPNNTEAFPGKMHSIQFKHSQANGCKPTGLNNGKFVADLQFHTKTHDDVHYHFSVKAMLQIDFNGDGIWDLTQYWPSKTGAGTEMWVRDKGYGPGGDKYYVFDDRTATAEFPETIREKFHSVQLSVWQDRYFTSNEMDLFLVSDVEEACNDVGCAHNYPDPSALHFPGFNPGVKPTCPRP